MVQLKSSLHNLLHLFFPHVCAGCGSDILDDKHELCLRCLSNLPVTNFFSQRGNPVEQMFYGRLPLRTGAAGYFFTKDSLIQILLHQLKYKGNKEIGFYLGRVLGQFLLKSDDFADVDAMIPLPLNPRRERKRGYNQATALCNGIASVWNKPVIERGVIRKVYTETQTKRGRINRWENMEGVFSVPDASVLQNQHLLLVDDVVTTGASLEACGSEILTVPGTTLSIATLACTL
jgi:ComF family protein